MDSIYDLSTSLIEVSFVDKWAAIVVFVRTLHISCADMPN